MELNFGKIVKYSFWIFIVLICLRLDLSPDTFIRKHPQHTNIEPSEKRFYAEVLPKLKDKKVVLVTNPSGIGNNPEKIQEKFSQYNVDIISMIGLEHGFLGIEEEFISKNKTIDPYFNLPVYHIYRLSIYELSSILQKADAVIFDVQDMGMRCYTYISVIKRLMDAIKNQNTELIVLDHINPSLHVGARGDTIHSGYKNFAGEFPSLFFTGLTIGESALYYNSEFLSNRVRLTIIPVENYKRTLHYEATGLLWNTPSPNLPNIESARNYLALVFLEGINVSVGRGTQAPFIYFGAPWFDKPNAVAKILNKNSNKNYFFQPVFFRPTFPPYKNRVCRGLRLTIMNIHYDPIQLGFNIIKTLKNYYRDSFRWMKDGRKYSIDHLWGSKNFRLAVDADLTYQEFYSTFKYKEQKLNRRLRKYHIYP